MSTAHTDWPKTLDWIENQTRESLKSRFDTAEILSREAQTTLTVLLAAVGGSAAYGAKIFDTATSGPLEIAAAVTCSYVVVLSLVLVTRCMMFVSYPAQHQDPANLMIRDHATDVIREAELTSLDARIKEAAAINRQRARNLNGIRLAASLTPLVFAVAAACYSARPVAKKEPTTVTCRVDWSEPAVPGLHIKCELPK